MTGARVRGGGRPGVGISRDSPWTHVAWIQALDLNFPLLSDWNAEAVRGFGVAHDFRGFKDVAERTASRRHGGTVRGAWRYETAEVPDFDECSRPPGPCSSVCALYLGAGVVATWPALQHAGSHFLADATPVPGEAAAGDHLQAECHLWLVGHQLRTDARPGVIRTPSVPRARRARTSAGGRSGFRSGR